MTRSGPNYGIEGPGMGLNEWNLALPLLQDIINSGLFVFNAIPMLSLYRLLVFFHTVIKIPAYTTGNREAIFDVMYITQTGSGFRSYVSMGSCTPGLF